MSAAQTPLFGLSACVTCKKLYEPVCGDSLYCSNKCCPADREQHSFWEDVSLLIERTHTNHCALCQTDVLNLCCMETVFCSEFCQWHYAEDPQEEEDWVEEDEDEGQNNIPFAEWKEKCKYASLTNAC